jgi:NAD-dependent dihydropyrimidine dehydrogenase PreA subunit
MYLLSPEDIRRLATEIARTHELHGPRSDPGTGQVFFDRLEDPGSLDLSAAIPSMPPKEVLFPQLERILRYRYDRDTKSVRLETRYAERPKALFGLRACDLAGIQCLDRFLLGQEFVDDVYRTHRAKSFIVANTCVAPWPQCFCVCTHTGPSAEEGYDLNLTLLPGADGKYAVEAGSERGRALAVKMGWKEAGEEVRRARTAVVERSIALFPEMATENKAWVSRVMNRVTTGFIKPEIWEYIGKQCFECGACSFVCPSCSCFNIEDAPLGSGECARLRTRDSCSFEGYTRMAGDHNPRKPVEDRRNKRFFCKLSFSQSKKYLRPGCVGCGRCAWVCPGDIGLPNVVQYIRRETHQ